MGVPLKAPSRPPEEVLAPEAAPPVQQVAPEAIAVPTVPPPAPAEPSRTRTCLIVDDSRVVRSVSRSIVQGLGYRILEAENGEEALARCRVDMPDLILLDWDMPVMTGIQFISALRALEGPRRPKAVFCTSRSETVDIYKGIEAGADEYGAL
jgi:two-component system, chemotaxis family, chemotaxis protein CheY